MKNNLINEIIIKYLNYRLIRIGGLILIALIVSIQLSNAVERNSEGTAGENASANELQQQRSVSGKVTDLQGEALLGVTVSVKGTSIGTVSDINGNYTIPNLPVNSTLVFTYLGMKTVEIAVGSQPEVNVILREDAITLGEVVAIGYGTMRKKDLTGSVSSIRMDRVENENPKRIADILRGNTPGLEVGLDVSAKGGGSLQIRGKNTLRAGSSPLIIMDGNIFYNDMANINPNDIESIDILRDASSTAVYGARAANGVILITTKTAKEESKPTINFNVHYSHVPIANMPKVYDHIGFMKWRSDAMKAMYYFDPKRQDKLYIYDDPRNLPSGVTEEMWREGSTADLLDIYLQRLGLGALEVANYKAGKYENWADYIFQDGFRHDYNTSISGKTKNSTYYWSLGYEDNKGNLIGEWYKGVHSLLKLESNITKWLSVGVNAMFSDRREGYPVTDTAMLRQIPPYGSRYEDDGVTLRRSPTNDPMSSINPGYDNQFIDRRRVIRTWTNTLFAKVKLPYDISYEFNFAPRFEYSEYMNHNSALHEDWGKTGGNSERNTTSLYGWELNNLIKWNKTFDKVHRFDVTLGAGAEQRQYWSQNISVQNFSPSDVLGYHRIQAATNAPVVSSNDEYSTADMLMGRLFYSFDSRYMLTLTMRRDGYSAFGLNNPYGYFPSVALAWAFTEEKILNNDFLTWGKLRLTWGENGNRDIGIYDALSNMSTGKYPYQTSAGTAYETSYLYVSRMANANLKWERKRSYNIGLDFGIKNDLLTGSIDAYKASTLDLLVSRKMPNVSGFTETIANMGQVDNTGLEVALNSMIMKHDNFQWEGNVTFYTNKNKIVHLYGTYEDILDEKGNVIGRKELSDIGNRWFIGHPIDEIWNYKVLGVWQLGQEDEAKRYGQFPGDFRILDLDNNGLYNDDDRVFQGNTVPSIIWSMRHSFTVFKNFQASFMLYSKWGHKTTYNIAKNSDGWVERQNSYTTPYWTPENPINDYSRIRSQTGGIAFDVYRDRSFIRMDNITLGYTIPKKYLKQAGIVDLKISGSVRNVFLWSLEWPNFYNDPETLERRTPRYFDIGINVTL